MNPMRVLMVRDGAVVVDGSYGIGKARVDQTLIDYTGKNKNRKSKKRLEKLASNDSAREDVSYKRHRGYEVRDRLRAKLAAKASSASSSNPPNPQ